MKIFQKPRIFELPSIPSASSFVGVLGVANGGTGLSSYAIGDLIYASGATTLSKLADVATGSVLISGGVGVAPSWSTTLTLGVASTTDGQIVLRNASNAFTTTLKTGVTGASYTLTLPTTDGDNLDFLQTNGSGVLTWAAGGGGITAGTTTVTSGTSGDVLMNISGVVGSATASANRAYRADQATPFNTWFGFGVAQSASFNAASCLNNVGIGYTSLAGITTGASNVSIGSNTMTQNQTGSNSTSIGAGAAGSGNINDVVAIGNNALAGIGAGVSNSVAIGSQAGRAGASNSIYIGFNAGYTSTNTSCIIIANSPGAVLTNTANNQGILGAPNANGYVSDWYFNGVTHTAPYSVNLRGSGGSGSNVVAANVNLYAGLSTGSGTPATIGFYSSAAGASSSTAQTAVKVFEITNSTTITTTDAVNYVLGSTTGTKWGTATTQKQAFWNATPIVQPTTAVAEATFVENAGGTAVNENSTFGGYTLQQVVQALQNIGLLA